jgi:Na+/H+-dicarboxylate symporter
MKNRGLILMLLGIVLGILGGLKFPEQMISMEWIGKLFINMLKLIALPLVFSALVGAIASIGDFRKLGTVGGYTLAYILISVSIAVTIGLVLINTFQPGIGVDSTLILGGDETVRREGMQFTTFIQGLFPPSIVDAAAKFEIMPVVIFAVVFSIGCIACGETAKPVIDFFVALRTIFIKIITWLMHLTPIGLFSLLGAAIAHAVENNQLMSSIRGMAIFIQVFLLGLLLHAAWQLLAVKFFAKRQAKHYIKTSASSLATAFGTSSSMATLPVALVAAQEQGVKPQVARFVLPFATTVNLAGTAMYESYSALFFSQVLGMNLGVWDQLGIFVIAIIAGMGATGIPEGGLVTMITVLRSVNIPTSAIALLLPFDRILDRFRTMLNIWGDLACANVVNHFIHFRGKGDELFKDGEEEEVLENIMEMKHSDSSSSKKGK